MIDRALRGYWSGFLGLKEYFASPDTADMFIFFQKLCGANERVKEFSTLLFDVPIGINGFAWKKPPMGRGEQLEAERRSLLGNNFCG